MNVVVISQDEQRRGEITGFLCERGFAVTAASTVVAVVSDGLPAMVIWDLDTQDVADSERLRAELRTRFEGQPHVVFALVPAECKESLGALIEAGFEDVGLRPLQLDRLVARVELGRRRLEQTISEAPVRELSRLLRAAADASNALLVHEDFDAAIHEALTALGRATGVDAVSIIECHAQPDSDTYATSTRFRWLKDAERLAAQPGRDLPLGPELPVSPHWIAEFRAGRYIAGPVSRFEPAERECFERMGIKSLLTMPLLPQEQLLGFVLLADCSRARVWTTDEVAILRAVAGAIGGAVLRRLSAQELERQEARFRSLVQNLPDTLAIIEPDGTILYHSPSSFQTVGVDPTQRVGESAYEFVHVDDRAELHALICELAEQPPGATATRELRVLRRGGVVRTVEVIATNLLHDPAVGGIVINSRDVTQQRDSEAALRQSEALFRTVVQTMSDFIMIVDRQGMARYISPAFEQVLGRRPEEIVGASAFALVHPDDLPVVVNAFEHVLTDPRRIPAALFRCRHADGSWRYIEATSSDHVDDPSIGGIVISARDVTMRRRAQEALAGQNRVLEMLSAGTPLTALFSELCDTIEQVIDDVRCSVLLLDESGTALVHGAAPRLPRSYWAAVDGAQIGPAAGACGAAAYLSETVISADIASDPKWEPWRELALSHGLRSCWSAPLLDPLTGRAFGAFAAYSDHPREPSAAELAFLVEAGRLASVAIQNTRDREALRTSEQRFRSMVQHGSEMITIVSGDGYCTYQSPSVERVLGYPWQHFVGVRALDYVHPDDREHVLNEIREFLTQPHAVRTFELRMQHADGSWIFLEMLATNLLHDPDVRGLVLNSRDITERKTLEDQLSWQAFHDTLTGLPNRALFRDRLEHALARSQRQGTSIAVMFLDLDRFKIVNDSLGHATGDDLLVLVGQRLLETLRDSDTLARQGGDEFTILVEDVVDVRELMLLAERLIERLRKPFTLGSGYEVFVAVSIGVAIGSAGHQDADELLRHADIALYRAKGDSRGSFEIFRPSMISHTAARLALETDLQRAIERGELRIQYQPEIDLRSGALCALEALVRWQHATRGMVLPAEFIQMAEETGLIVPIGRWVLEEACRQAARWPAGPDGALPMLSVNLSARELQQPDLIAFVEMVLGSTGFDPQRLRLEITESVLVQEAQTTLATVRGLKALGIQIAIDDFGVGYSSLSYLTRLPIDTLKIDRLFVSGEGREIGNLAIIKAVTSLAQALEMTVTAEGIETVEQLLRVAEAGCQNGQGHYFAQAIAAADVAAMIEQGAFVVRLGPLTHGPHLLDSVAS